MPLRKFFARDARSALGQIRRELGDDAVVVTTRKRNDGVEMLAGRYVDISLPTLERQTAAATPSEASRAETGVSQPVWHELSRLRHLLQNQLAGLAWSLEKRRHPVRVHVMQRLLAAGFGARLSRHVAASLPGRYTQSQADAWLRQVMIRNLVAYSPAMLPEVAGGAWALVGPTGQGKTTSLAKLTARAVLAHGANKVVLVSTDTYRLGAVQQLEAYARLMGVDLIRLESVEGIAEVLRALTDKHCVLIDSAGFSPNDARFAAQIAAFKQSGVKCLLTVSGSTQGGLMEHLIAKSAPHGVILTKLDEGGQFGAVLDSLMRHRIAVAALATGQRVPEDLHCANVPYLIDRAFRSHEHEAFVLREDDRPLQMAAMEDAAGDAGQAGEGGQLPDLSVRSKVIRL